MMQHFPIHCTHNAGIVAMVTDDSLYVCVCVCVSIELDWRRLNYLGNSIEEQLHLETKLGIYNLEIM